MNQIKSLLITILFSGLLFAVPAAVVGQSVEPSYEVSLQLLMGSNETGSKASLPSNLSGVSQQLKSGFAYSNLRLATTIIGRMTNHGDFEYKSFSDLFGSENDPKFRSFLELNIGGFKSGMTEKSAAAFHVQSFRLGARVPVIFGSRKDEAGKDQPIVNYEQIGLTLRKVGLSENVPTLIGTLELPNVNEMLFLVMTVKSVDL